MTTDNPSTELAVKSHIDAKLNPKENAHASPVYQEKVAFLNSIEAKLKKDPKYADPENAALLKAKMDSVAKELDEKLSNNALEQAKVGGDPNAYSAPSKQEQRMSQGIIGMVEKAFDSIAGMLGGAFSMVWSFLKNLPFVGDMIAGIGGSISGAMTGKPSEQRAKEKLAAGVADGFSKEVLVEGEIFKLPEKSARILYLQMAEANLNVPSGNVAVPVESSPVVVPPQIPFARAPEPRQGAAQGVTP